MFCSIALTDLLNFLLAAIIVTTPNLKTGDNALLWSPGNAIPSTQMIQWILQQQTFAGIGGTDLTLGTPVPNSGSTTISISTAASGNSYILQAKLLGGPTLDTISVTFPGEFSFSSSLPLSHYHSLTDPSVVVTPSDSGVWRAGNQHSVSWIGLATADTLDV